MNAKLLCPILLVMSFNLYAEALYTDYVNYRNEATDLYREVVSDINDRDITNLLNRSLKQTTQNITYDLYNRNGGLSCTGFINGLLNFFKYQSDFDISTHVSHDKSPYVYSSQYKVDWAVAHNSRLKRDYDVYQKEIVMDGYNRVIKINNPGFRPKKGDLLVYPPRKMRKDGKFYSTGHIVMVVDPQKCIAVHSSSFTYDYTKYQRDNDARGVMFHKIVNKDRCNNGVWYAWDNTWRNEFWTLIRPKKGKFSYNDYYMRELHNLESISNGEVDDMIGPVVQDTSDILIVDNSNNIDEIDNDINNNTDSNAEDIVENNDTVSTTQNNDDTDNSNNIAEVEDNNSNDSEVENTDTLSDNNIAEDNSTNNDSANTIPGESSESIRIETTVDLRDKQVYAIIGGENKAVWSDAQLNLEKVCQVTNDATKIYKVLEKNTLFSKVKLVNADTEESECENEEVYMLTKDLLYINFLPEKIITVKLGANYLVKDLPKDDANSIDFLVKGTEVVVLSVKQAEDGLWFLTNKNLGWIKFSTLH